MGKDTHNKLLMDSLHLCLEIVDKLQKTLLFLWSSWRMLVAGFCQTSMYRKDPTAITHNAYMYARTQYKEYNVPDI